MIKHIENDQARVDLDTGGYLLIEHDLNLVLVNGETELTDVDMKDCLFSVRGDIYTGLDIMQRVAAHWDTVLAEQSQAEADEAAHIERYSSVEGSGRI